MRGAGVAGRGSRSPTRAMGSHRSTSTGCSSRSTASAPSWARSRARASAWRSPRASSRRWAARSTSRAWSTSGRPSRSISTLTEDPLERYERTAAATDRSPFADRPGRTVLQIEDNASNVNLVERIMQRRPGHRPRDRERRAARGRTGEGAASRTSSCSTSTCRTCPATRSCASCRRTRRHARSRSSSSPPTRPTTPGRSGCAAPASFAYLTKPLDVARVPADGRSCGPGRGRPAAVRPEASVPR